MLAVEEVPHYTYANYLEWDENVRSEIIDGEITIRLSPTRDHQEVITELLGRLWEFLRDKPGKVYTAPLPVRLNPQDDGSDDTVLEPDILVVRNPAQLDKQGCRGAPDFVIEVLSPATARYDRLVKFRKYQIAGVQEYWIVDPETQTIQVCVLENGHYTVSMYGDAEDDMDTDTIPVTVLPGCEIKVQEIFGD